LLVESLMLELDMDPVVFSWPVTVECMEKCQIFCNLRDKRVPLSRGWYVCSKEESVSVRVRCSSRSRDLRGLAPGLPPASRRQCA
jgi:hypothetical protein